VEKRKGGTVKTGRFSRARDPSAFQSRLLAATQEKKKRMSKRKMSGKKGWKTADARREKRGGLEVVPDLRGRKNTAAEKEREVLTYPPGATGEKNPKRAGNEKEKTNSRQVIHRYSTGSFYSL